MISSTAAPWPGLDVACHSPFFALLSNASGAPAQPLVMQSNSQFLHWTLSPPKQGFPPLANFELHNHVLSNSHSFFPFLDLSLLSTSYSVKHSLSPILVFCSNSDPKHHVSLIIRRESNNTHTYRQPASTTTICHKCITDGVYASCLSSIRIS